MALPSRLSKRLRQVLGVEAGDDMVTFLEELRSERAELRAAIQRFDDKLTETRVDLAERIANVKADVANVKADLMKWSFLFWVGAVAAIAMLAGVLDRRQCVDIRHRNVLIPCVEKGTTRRDHRRYDDGRHGQLPNLSGDRKPGTAEQT